MIRLTSTQQALSLRGTIPELAVIRSTQFMSDGGSHEEHGDIIVIQERDDISQITEIGPNGFYVENDLPTYEFVDAFIEGPQIIYEALYQIDNSRAEAVSIPDGPRSLLICALF